MVAHLLPWGHVPRESPLLFSTLAHPGLPNVSLASYLMLSLVWWVEISSVISREDAFVKCQTRVVAPIWSKILIGGLAFGKDGGTGKGSPHAIASDQGSSFGSWLKCRAGIRQEDETRGEGRMWRLSLFQHEGARGITPGHCKQVEGGKTNFSPPPGGDELLMCLSSWVNLVRNQEKLNCQVERFSN